MRRIIIGAILLVSLGTGLVRADEISCGSLVASFGPYDYRTDKPDLPVVERAHFSPQVEFLVHGITTSLGGDIGYVLATFPNHHRALWSMMKLTEKLHTLKPYGAKYNLECYFDRAIRWRPDDGVVRMIYGTWLTRQGRREESIVQLGEAVRLDGDNPNLAYNIGLAYFKLKLYDEALISARKAYAGGYSLPGLKKELESVGKWSEPPGPASPPPHAVQSPADAPTPEKGSQ